MTQREQFEDWWTGSGHYLDVCDTDEDGDYVFEDTRAAWNAWRTGQKIGDATKALRLFVAQWNACGPNSDFGRYFQNVRDAAVAALAKVDGE